MRITPLRSLKDVLWEAQDGECWICRRRMIDPVAKRGHNHPDRASLDHVFPRSKFRKMGDIGIVLLAHQACNQARRDPWPSDDEIRSLVRVWRRVDRNWLEAQLELTRAQIEGLRLQETRSEILALFAA